MMKVESHIYIVVLVIIKDLLRGQALPIPLNPRI